jgi:methylated-DNA-[protein]-cysteine S-methyltransferase
LARQWPQPDFDHRPCHRVIGASGSLTGFAGGLAKQYLLALEGRQSLALDL